jgi:hypothetical protein
MEQPHNQEIDDWIFESLIAQDAADQAERDREAAAAQSAPNSTDLEATVQAMSREEEAPQEQGTQPKVDEDPTQLARAAQDVLNAVSNNQTDKFKKSAFFELMDKIATGSKVLQNKEFVDASDKDAPTSASTQAPAPGTSQPQSELRF